MISKSHFNFKKDGTPKYNCFCQNPELIENYDAAIADTIQTWECHHRKEFEFSKKELISLGLYYDRPPEELIFLTPAQHRKLHHKGKKMSDEFRKKLSEYMKGKHHSEETKKKCGAVNKGKHWRTENGRRVWY